MARNDSNFALGFLVGGIVGTVVGILIAPQSGAVTRADLAERSEEWRRRGEDLRARVSPLVETVRDRMGQEIDELKKEVRRAQGQGTEGVEATEKAGDEPEDPQEG